MNPQPTDRLHFDLQLAYARPVIALLAILCLLELRNARQAERPLSFLIAYLSLSVIILLIERALRRANWHIPLVCDILVVGTFLYLSPEVLPAWFLLFFVAFSADIAGICAPRYCSPLDYCFWRLRWRCIAMAQSMVRVRSFIHCRFLARRSSAFPAWRFWATAIANSPGNKPSCRDCPPPCTWSWVWRNPCAFSWKKSPSNFNPRKRFWPIVMQTWSAFSCGA